MNQRFYKSERLKSKKAIEALFSDGYKITSYPIKLIYLTNENPTAISHQAGFSVPKKTIKKAVERNKIKRRMREAYRKNKQLLTIFNPTKLFLMFIFTGRENCSYAVIEEKIKSILIRLNENFSNPSA